MQGFILVFRFFDLTCWKREVLVANMAEVEMFACCLVIHIDVFLSQISISNYNDFNYQSLFKYGSFRNFP